MKLHEDKEQLADAIRITAAELGIPQKFVEKDYWICQILQRLSRMTQAERTVWKGGTSLTKGYGIIQRFSSDIDRRGGAINGLLDKNSAESAALIVNG